RCLPRPAHPRGIRPRRMGRRRLRGRRWRSRRTGRHGRRWCGSGAGRFAVLLDPPRTPDRSARPHRGTGGVPARADGRELAGVPVRPAQDGVSRPGAARRARSAPPRGRLPFARHVAVAAPARGADRDQRPAYRRRGSRRGRRRDRRPRPAGPTVARGSMNIEALAPLRSRNYRLLFTSIAASAVGDWLDVVAVLVLVTTVWHRGAFGLALVAIVLAAPRL